MEYTATFHESSLGVNLERAVLHGPAHRKGKGVEVAVVRSISNSNKRDKAALRDVKVGDFVISVNGEDALGPGFAAVCNMITTASRPVTVGFQRLEKAIKADFRKASKGTLLREIGQLSKQVAELHERRNELQQRARQLEPEKDALLGKVQGVEQQLDELARARERGSDAARDLRGIEDRISELTAAKKKLVSEVKAVQKHLRAKEMSHDLVYYASVGVQQVLAGQVSRGDSAAVPAVRDRGAVQVDTGTAGVDFGDAGVTTPLNGGGSSGGGGDTPWTPRQLQTLQCVVKLHKRLRSARKRIAQRGAVPSPAGTKQALVASRIRGQALRLAKSLASATSASAGSPDAMVTERALKVALLMVDQNARLQALLEAELASKPAAAAAAVGHPRQPGRTHGHGGPVPSMSTSTSAASNINAAAAAATARAGHTPGNAGRTTHLARSPPPPPHHPTP